MGVPCCLVKILMQFHSTVKHQVGKEGHTFNARRGSRQGSVEAPILFSIVFEYLIRASRIMEERGCGFNFGHMPVTFGGKKRFYYIYLVTY